ncbi:hypothetical protein [Glycomyces tarimensis]
MRRSGVDAVQARCDRVDGYPSRVEYRLTGMGAETTKLLYRLVDHLQDHMPEVLKARAAYDERRPGES